MKSVTELILAAGTQLSAEANRRGVHRLVPEVDFVFAGILTAMIGKYYSMWRVAPTASGGNCHSEQTTTTDLRFVGVAVPSNSFQPFLLDGVTRPDASQRLLALIAPMPSLFRAGFFASALGYGFTAFLIALRSLLMPSFETATRNINILHASVFTGVFMATISNIRYQILQGIIEPLMIDKLRKFVILHAILTFLVRLGNGFLGSVLAIMGMRRLGLQQLK
jgi:hypothetical protein